MLRWRLKLENREEGRRWKWGNGITNLNLIDGIHFGGFGLCGFHMETDLKPNSIIPNKLPHGIEIQFHFHIPQFHRTKRTLNVFLHKLLYLFLIVLSLCNFSY